MRSDPSGISCPSRCSASYPYETRVSLRAAPKHGWRFDGWSRSDTCSKLDVVCDVTLVDPAFPRATFVPVEVSSNILPDGRWQAFVRDVSERNRAAIAAPARKMQFARTSLRQGERARCLPSTCANGHDVDALPSRGDRGALGGVPMLTSIDLQEPSI